MNRDNSKLLSARQMLMHVLNDLQRAGSTATVLFHAAIADRLGLGPTDHKALDFLFREGPLSAGEIGHRTGITSASVTTLIDRLEGRGFVRRVRDANDRRRVLVEVNPDGVDEVRELFEPLARDIEKVMEGFSDEQLNTIREYLEKSTEIVMNHARRIGTDEIPSANRNET